MPVGVSDLQLILASPTELEYKLIFKLDFKYDLPYDFYIKLGGSLN